MIPAAVAFEGFFASRNPGSVLLAGPIEFRAGVNGLAIARFGWADVESGLVDNVRTTPQQLQGFVFPIVSGFSSTQIVLGVRYARPGVAVTLMQRGDYWVRFPGGARRGAQVYASLVDGTAVSGQAANTEATQWFVATDAGPGSLAIISTSSKVTS
jgi:hypothetical protein